MPLAYLSSKAHRRTLSQRFPVESPTLPAFPQLPPPAMGSPRDLPPPSPSSPPFSPTFGLAAFAAPGRKPRAYWYRTTFLALFALVGLSVYVLLIAQPSLSAIPRFEPDGRPFAGAAIAPPAPAAASASSPHVSLEAARLATLRQKHPLIASAAMAHAERPQIALDPAQELAAVSSFLVSLPQNVIPTTVDPAQPIDPQLVLDFDTRGPRAEEELAALVGEVWQRNPVLLYSKFYSPVSREIKQILADMYLRPPPTIIEVDQRTDESVLAPLLLRLTGETELPVLLIGGESVGTIEQIRTMRKRGQLQRMLTNAGTEIYGAQRKQKKL